MHYKRLPTSQPQFGRLSGRETAQTPNSGLQDKPPTKVHEDMETAVLNADGIGETSPTLAGDAFAGMRDAIMGNS